MILQPARGLPPGIFFNLPMDTYRVDPAISRSDILNLVDTPNTYWKNSSMNPERKSKRPTEDMEYGSALHCLLFEPHLFEQQYQVVPIDKWDDSKKKITADMYWKLVDSVKVLRAGKDSNLFLSGGRAEVTIIFEMNGIRYRTRHDYFTPVCTSDFKKSWSLQDGHLKRDFEKFGYDIQLALYKLSRRRLREQFLAGEAHVYGECDPEWWNLFLQSRLDEFVFIFQRDTDPFPYRPLMPEDDTEDAGIERIARGTAVYKKYLKECGTYPWPICEGRVQRWSMFYGTIRNEN